MNLLPQPTYQDYAQHVVQSYSDWVHAGGGTLEGAPKLDSLTHEQAGKLARCLAELMCATDSESQVGVNYTWQDVLPQEYQTDDFMFRDD